MGRKNEEENAVYMDDNENHYHCQSKFRILKKFYFLIDSLVMSGIISNRNRTLFLHLGGMPWTTAITDRDQLDRLFAR
jgi:hypothetical protein